MQLSLKITSYHRLTPGQQEVFQPHSDSFTIGRSDENDWAIPDPQRFLSGVHCRIHCEGDRYYITDTSTNGVFLNGSDTRLERNETVELSHGDKIRIGDYEFEALIKESNSSASPVTDGTETVVETDPFEDSFDDSRNDLPLMTPRTMPLMTPSKNRNHSHPHKRMMIVSSRISTHHWRT